ncbi:DUF6242 domain-containing protein, partial [Silvanigrella paludirubra]|uniref:DUF6242 domain-containing protein n=1 Tax=Silvanigrella paludirubra TaxID=2499159 RepID=UPI00192A1773
INGTTQVSTTTANDFTNPVTYTITAQDGVSNNSYTVTVTYDADPGTLILTFSFNINGTSYYGTIDQQNFTINVSGVPFGTDLTSLVATFSLSAGASATVNGTTQVSATTANDFTNPVTYTITAQDGITIAIYTVTIDPGDQIFTFSFNINGTSYDGIIDQSNYTIDVSRLPYGTDLTNLIAAFTLSSGATATVNGTTQVSTTTPNDFTNPVTYTITAQDGITIANYTINVSVLPPPFAIFYFKLSNIFYLGNIDHINHTINVIGLPFGTDLSNLVAYYSLAPHVVVKVNGVTQSQGVTTNNFMSPVIYVFTRFDSFDVNYTVTVSTNGH